MEQSENLKFGEGIQALESLRSDLHSWLMMTLVHSPQAHIGKRALENIDVTIALLRALNNITSPESRG